jgi:DNA-binding MarR family transcriptional regulator
MDVECFQNVRCSPFLFLLLPSCAIVPSMVPFQTNKSRPSTLETVLRLHGFFRHRLQSLGVSPVQASTLLYLDRHPQAEVTEITYALCIQNLSAVKTVQLLQRNGWIRKPRINANRKTVKLQLTEKGTALAQKIKANLEITDKLFAMADHRKAA